MFISNELTMLRHITAELVVSNYWVQYSVQVIVNI
jgi:hypothetical protein